jgi:arginyl-tRNA--protein-N-Asp/Glu arginylyltransferase
MQSRDANYQVAWELYKGRCVLCERPAEVVHEDMPKSVKRRWQTLSNRSPLCNDCHEKVHREGAVQYNNTLKRRKRILRQKYYDTQTEVRDGEGNMDR